MMSDATQLSHYTNYPMCGYCTNAWNIVFGRSRTIISCERWLKYCKWGGCDPDIWEYLDERTGWPLGWKVDPKTMWPRCFTDSKVKLPIPDFDNRVFHMRANDDPTAPWRKTSERLRAAAIDRKGKIKGIKVEDITDWNDGGPEEEPDPAEQEFHEATDLDDPDLW